MQLILFDIDGTLITTEGAGRRALARALEAVFGTSGGLAAYDLRGKTDRRIVLDVLAAAGLNPAVVDDRLDSCFQAYVRALAEEIGDGGRVSTLPGIASLVRHLEAHSDVVLGLVTGNIEEGARIKLTPTGLWPCFRTGVRLRPRGPPPAALAGSPPRPCADRIRLRPDRRARHRRHAVGHRLCPRLRRPCRCRRHRPLPAGRPRGVRSRPPLRLLRRGRPRPRRPAPAPAQLG